MTKKFGFIIYGILFALAFLTLFISCGIAICNYKEGLPEGQESFFICVLMLAALLFFVIVRKIACFLERKRRRQNTGLKKRKSYFLREVLPVIFVYILVFGSGLLYFFFVLNGKSAPISKDIITGKIYVSSFLSVKWLYNKLIYAVSFLFGFEEISVFAVNMLIRVLTVLFGYAFLRNVCSKSAGIFFAVIYSAIPYFYRNITASDPGMLYILIVVFFLLISMIVSNCKYICERKFGFILFLVYGIICALSSYAEPTFFIFVIIGPVFVLWDIENESYKINGKCILFTILGIVAGLIAVLAMYYTAYYVDAFNKAVTPSLRPMPSFFGSFKHYDFVVVLLSGLPLFMQKGNKINVMSHLSLEYVLLCAIAVLGLFPGNNMYLFYVISAISLSMGLGMTGLMKTPDFKKDDSAKPIETEVKETESAKNDDVISEVKKEETKEEFFTDSKPIVFTTTPPSENAEDEIQETPSENAEEDFKLKAIIRVDMGLPKPKKSTKSLSYAHNISWDKMCFDVKVDPNDDYDLR